MCVLRCFDIEGLLLAGSSAISVLHPEVLWTSLASATLYSAPVLKHRISDHTTCIL